MNSFSALPFHSESWQNVNTPSSIVSVRKIFMPGVTFFGGSGIGQCFTLHLT